MEAVAGDLAAAVDQLPELDATTVFAATLARMKELEARRAAQAEADADRLQRETKAQAALAAETSVTGPEAEAPGAWVPGPATPAYGGPGAAQKAPEPQPAHAEPEAGL